LAIAGLVAEFIAGQCRPGVDNRRTATIANTMFLKRLLLALVVLCLLAALFLWAALSWSYSTGERAGWVQKLSKKGWVCKTWEGELAMVSLPGVMPEKFPFTIRDDSVAEQVTQAMGKRVALHYEEKVGLPTTCFGETRHFVTHVTVADEISIAPGVGVPQPQAAASAAPASSFPAPPSFTPSSPTR
jgi:hypothetical protein